MEKKKKIEIYKAVLIYLLVPLFLLLIITFFRQFGEAESDAKGSYNGGNFICIDDWNRRGFFTEECRFIEFIKNTVEVGVIWYKFFVLSFVILPVAVLHFFFIWLIYYMDYGADLSKNNRPDDL